VAPGERGPLAAAAADTVKRVYAPRTGRHEIEDWYAEPGIARLGAFCETKTVWHPIGV
jgi:hypothetical protein